MWGEHCSWSRGPRAPIRFGPLSSGGGRGWPFASPHWGPRAKNTRAPCSPSLAPHRRGGHPNPRALPAAPRETHARNPPHPAAARGPDAAASPAPGPRATWGRGREAGGQAAGRPRAGAAPGEGPRGRHQAHGAPGAEARRGRNARHARAGSVLPAAAAAPGPDPGGREEGPHSRVLKGHA